VSLQELAARLESGWMRPSHIHARKCLPAGREAPRQIRITARVTGADHELSAIALRANRCVGAFAPNREADIVRTADAGFDEQLRHTGREHRAVFEPVVRHAEISIVANQRWPQESGVTVIAAAVDAERHAEPSGTHAKHGSTWTEISLGVDFYQLHAPAVGIRGAEHIAADRIDTRNRFADKRCVAGPPIAPCRFRKELDASRRFTRQS
jgi:hypothetical protein